MADENGKVPPPPLRPRPRPGAVKGSGPDGPVRPAPPPPAGAISRPPPIPTRSASLEKKDDVALFKLPPPPKACKGASNYGSTQSTSGTGSTRRGKLEIKIVDAKPMSEVGFRDNQTKPSGGNKKIKTPDSSPLLIDFDCDWNPPPTTKAQAPSPPEKATNGGPRALPPKPTIIKTSPASPPFVPTGGHQSRLPTQSDAITGSLIDMDMEQELQPEPAQEHRSRSPGPPRPKSPSSQARARSASPRPPRPAPPRPTSPAPSSKGPPRPRSPSPCNRGAPPRPRSPSPRPPASRPAPPRPSSPCPARPKSPSIIKTSPQDDEDIEVMENMANERLLEINEPKRPAPMKPPTATKPMLPKPTVIRAKPPELKSPDDNKGPAKVRTVTKITTTTVTKQQKPACVPTASQIVLGGVGMGMMSAALSSGMKATSQNIQSAIENEQKSQNGDVPSGDKKVKKTTVVTNAISRPAGLPTSSEVTEKRPAEKKFKPTIIRPQQKTSPEEPKPSAVLNEVFDNDENELRAKEMKSIDRPSSLNPNEIGKKKVSAVVSAPTKKKSAPPPRPASGPTKPPPPKKASVGGPPRPNLPKSSSSQLIGQPHGKAIYDYAGQQADELSFKGGDLIALVKEVDSDWYIGRLGNAEGMFPKNFIDVIEPLQESRKSSITYPTWDEDDSQSGPRCCANFDFNSEAAEDLSFKTGDVIELVDRVDSEWLKGCLKGKTGVFPATFVEILEDLPPPKTPSPEKDSTDSNTAKASHDFNGQEGELSLKAGQKVKVLNRVTSDWLYGELAGKRGMFPANFIDRVPPTLPFIFAPNHSTVQVAVATHVTSKHSHSKPSSDSESEPHCIALYAFEGQADGDLSFQEGDRIALTGNIGDDWLRGSLEGRDGIFPKDFVDVIVNFPDDGKSSPSSDSHSASPDMPSNDDLPKARALYDFQGNEGELTFKAGDVVMLFDKVDTDWMVGEHDGIVGQFPTSFVEVLTPLP